MHSQQDYHLIVYHMGPGTGGMREMEASRVIQPSNSEWAFPIVMVKKKDGSLCFCVDYCRLKSVVTTNAYPMPRVDELIDCLGNAKFIPTLDLTRGYWLVLMEEAS